MKQKPQVETGITQCNLDPLLTAFPQNPREISNVSGFDPMVAIANEPERIALAKVKFLHERAQTTQDVLRRRLTLLSYKHFELNPRRLKEVKVLADSVLVLRG